LPYGLLKTDTQEICPLAWAARIPDADNRANVGDEILLTYLEKDPTAAIQSVINEDMLQERRGARM
jgi:hypothetical protein